MEAKRLPGLNVGLAIASAMCVVALCSVPMVGQAARGPSRLTISNAWIRAIGGPTPAAGYFTLANSSDRPRTLIGASSPDCGKLMMHQSRNVGGVESMAMVGRIEVPSHGRIVFSPGGYHLMCVSPSGAVRPGAQIPVSLRFVDGQRLEVRFVVRTIGGAG